MLNITKITVFLVNKAFSRFKVREKVVPKIRQKSSLFKCCCCCCCCCCCEMGKELLICCGILELLEGPEETDVDPNETMLDELLLPVGAVCPLFEVIELVAIPETPVVPLLRVFVVDEDPALGRIEAALSIKSLLGPAAEDELRE